MRTLGLDPQCDDDACLDTRALGLALGCAGGVLVTSQEFRAAANQPSAISLKVAATPAMDADCQLCSWASRETGETLSPGLRCFHLAPRSSMSITSASTSRRRRSISPPMFTLTPSVSSADFALGLEENRHLFARVFFLETGRQSRPSPAVANERAVLECDRRAESGSGTPSAVLSRAL